MKIIVTGSLGHISKPLAEELVKRGHEVTVISSNPDREELIREMGARAAIGSVKDAEFLAEVFKGADAAYTMVPPVSYFNPNLDPVAYFSSIGNNYASAIERSGIKHVVNLSSWGADLDKGNGGIAGAHYLEKILDLLPTAISITHLRPTSFYYNLFAFIPAIKNTGIMAAAYGGNDRTVLVDPKDIAAAAVEELEKSAAGRSIRYVASDELTCSEVAGILGEAIGMPDLKWIVIPGEKVMSRLEAAGMPPHMAAGMVELQTGHHSGIIAEDYYRNRPEKLGDIKTRDFAKTFAAAFEQK